MLLKKFIQSTEVSIEEEKLAEDDKTVEESTLEWSVKEEKAAEMEKSADEGMAAEVDKSTEKVTAADKAKSAEPGKEIVTVEQAAVQTEGTTDIPSMIEEEVSAEVHQSTDKGKY